MLPVLERFKATSVYTYKQGPVCTGLQGKWVMLSAQYIPGTKAGGIRLYTNQVDVTSIGAGGTNNNYVAMHNQTADLTVGRFATTYSNGKVGYVALFNAAFSPVILTNFYNSTKGAYGIP